MTQADIENVIAIEAASYGEHHWSKESFFNELSNELAKYYCAFDNNGNLMGYAGTWQILEEAHLTNIAVSPDFRRRKVAESLLAVVIDECRKNGIKYITLEVRVSNTPAINLYEKYGFKSLGTRKGYYQNNNEDALIMWTENMFYDKFKVKYEKNLEDLKRAVNIL
ncbi:TPA: ribosomal protein S18-alanine N-acetyltransferase [Candidatus Scatousia excrementigallinarum]|uniref:Ribosomal protein S18-alanine N-acetyltransferase n=1 Tax=Candidatus Scatousia excrementigallinarum TaxID=2840935 RepID=A0A9D1EWU8_9BACT|nr:ribosomal protein S18-alanine N-acetyltransferase [Candidatus Scatousia excrementigallinarum]